MTIQEWIQANVKPGVDVSEGLKLIPENPIDKVSSKEEALAIIQKNGFFTAAMDYHTTQKIEAHDKKFMETKFPELLKEEKEKIRKELNPNEDPVLKVSREFEEYKRTTETKNKQLELKANLRRKAQELKLKFDQDRAERYHVFGESALDELEKDSNFLNEYINNQVQELAKQKFGKEPTAGGEFKGKTMKRDEFFNLSPQEQKDFTVKEGGKVID